MVKKYSNLTIFFIAVFLIYPYILSAMDNGLKPIVAHKEVANVKSGSNDNKIQAEQPLYVVFDNIDKVYNSQGQLISNLIDLYYYDFIKTTSIEFQDYIIKAPFSDGFFSSNNITDFDVAIFPMGDEPLTYKTAGGRSVIGTINEMLDNGKRVMVIGRQLMYQAFGGSDQPSKDFFTNTLGVNYMGRIPVSHPIGGGTQFDIYWINGRQGDPVSLGYRKGCNGGVSDDGGTLHYSLTNYFTIDAFKLAQGSTGIPFDFFGKYEDPNVYQYKDTIIGIRAVTAKSKVVFWSIGFDNVCIPSYTGYAMIGALRWFTEDILKPGPWLLFSQNPLDFGDVAIGANDTREVELTNFGRKPLIIEDMYIAGFDDPVFSIVSGFTPGHPVTIPPEGKHKIRVKLEIPETAEKGRKYEDLLAVVSNADNGNEQDIDIQGWAGTSPLKGPIIDIIPDTVIFGSIRPGKVLIREFVFINKGNAPLIIDQQTWRDTLEKSFSYEYNFKLPITLEMDQTDTVQIRFAPVEEGKDYTNAIDFKSNDPRNQNIATVVFKGTGGLDPNKGPQITPIKTSIEFGKIDSGRTERVDLGIMSTGTSDLTINNVEIIDDSAGVFTFDEPIDVPFTLEPLIRKYFYINFTPKEPNMDYYARIKITSDARQLPIAYVQMHGQSWDDTTSVSETLNDNSFFTLEAAPNPFEHSSKVMFELKGNTAKSLELIVIDLHGNKVASLMNAAIYPGKHETVFKANGLSSGMYYIVARIGGKSIELPVVIQK